MRDLIRIITEGEVVDLGKHKVEKAVGEYSNAVQAAYSSEAEFFASGKFMPFARSYIESGFDPEKRPEIDIDVSFRDHKRSPEARLLWNELRSRGFKMTPARWAKGYAPKENPRQEQQGGFARKTLDINTAKRIFAERVKSPFGAYQPSRSGFRTSSHKVWDDRGVGFHIIVSGYDGRRPGKYADEPQRYETHIIDNDRDMKEVADMFAAIERARMKSV